jgi:hypothetical protein
MKSLSINFTLSGNIKFKPKMDLSLIAIGSTREVYKVQNKPHVLKVSKEVFFEKKELGITFKFNPNKIEWDIFNIIKKNNQVKYFAKCIDISICNQYLLMEYAPKSSSKFKEFLIQNKINIKNITSNDFYMIDLDLRNDINRFQNWGILNNSMVITDYGSTKNLKYLKKYSI